MPDIAPAPPILSIADFLADPVEAADFPALTLRWRNDRSAQEIGLAGLGDDQWRNHFGRFQPLEQNLPEPLALRYHGHQFQHYNPDIGDGRGFLFAQLRDDAGRLIDLGTKGSGQTPYSRQGDGRLTLKGAMREILATEMLEALGVPTSRTFSVIETHEQLFRGDEPSPTRSAVLVRQSHGHIRFGSFQRLAALDDAAAMHRLVDYALAQYGDWADAPADMEPAARLLNLVAERMARLSASYMAAGFVHGVLNTDNMNISGESFDYGPWRFAPGWIGGFTAAYFDQNGLYAFGRQPQAIYWNCGQLAAALRLICDSAPLVAALERFGGLFLDALAAQFCWRLGVKRIDAEADRAFIQAAEAFLITQKDQPGSIDHFFHAYRGGQDLDRLAATGPEGAALAGLLADRAMPRAAWFATHEPETMLIDEVESLWSAIDTRDDWQPLADKIVRVRAMGSALCADGISPAQAGNIRPLNKRP